MGRKGSGQAILGWGRGFGRAGGGSWESKLSGSRNRNLEAEEELGGAGGRDRQSRPMARS